MSAYYKIESDNLTRFIIDILVQTDIASGQAVIIADTLVRADLRGINSHGMIRFPFYVKRLLDGGTKVNPNFSIERESIATAVFNGDNGMGQIVTYQAMNLAINKAKKAGIAYITINNSNHFGIASYYAMQALEHDMIGIVWSNGPSNMAPWGGSSRVIGNNPLAVAIPAGEREPIVLDISMGKVAGGKVRLAAKEGKKIPKDWIISKEGRVTDDPEDLPDGGALMALGHKGYGLAIVGEVLSGVLSGAGLLTQIPMWFKATEQATNIGHMVMTINIEDFMETVVFKKRVDYLIDELKASKLAAGYDEILVPGEIEVRKEREQLQDGIELPARIIDELDQMAQDFQVPAIKRVD